MRPPGGMIQRGEERVQSKTRTLWRGISEIMAFCTVVWCLIERATSLVSSRSTFCSTAPIEFSALFVLWCTVLRVLRSFKASSVFFSSGPCFTVFGIYCLVAAFPILCFRRDFSCSVLVCSFMSWQTVERWTLEPDRRVNGLDFSLPGSYPVACYEIYHPSSYSVMLLCGQAFDQDFVQVG